MNRLMTLTCAALASCGIAATTASAAQPLRTSDILRDYDVRLSVSMKSNFSFNPDPTGCNGNKPAGWAGAGEEILQMKSPKPVRVTLFTPPDSVPAVTRKDLKPGFEVRGESRRSGDMTRSICDETHPGQAVGCTGKFNLDQKLQLSFFRGEVQFSKQSGPNTRDAIKSCTDQQFDWDGAVARTGTTMLFPAKGAAPRSKLKARSFTLEAREVEECDVDYFGLGACKTEWIYRANFRQVKRKRG